MALAVVASLVVPAAAKADVPTTETAAQHWRLKYSESFNKSFSTKKSPWIRDTNGDPFDTIMDDNGDWWKNDGGPAFTKALNSFATYQKSVTFGKNGWLTAAVSARDWNDSGTPQRGSTIATKRLRGQGKVLKIDSPDSYDGALVTTTEKLPPQYRLQYTLKTLDFGGKRNGSVDYDGKTNGYSKVPGECKTQFPYDEGIGTRGWDSVITSDPCDWQSVVDGPYGYNAFHYLGIVDFAHPAPANLHFWHYRRKILMDSFSQSPDRTSGGSGGRVCDPATNTYSDYKDSSLNVVDMWINGLPNWSPGKGGITGNGQYFMTTCGGGVADNSVSPSAAAEIQPELMPRQTYTFAIERDKTGYTEEITGKFRHVKHRTTIRFHRNFIADGVPIWHYNNTPDQYDGQYNHALTQNGEYASETWPDQWPAGSGYPDYPVIGDPYTDAGEGSATIDSIKLFVPSRH